MRAKRTDIRMQHQMLQAMNDHKTEQAVEDKAKQEGATKPLHFRGPNVYAGILVDFLNLELDSHGFHVEPHRWGIPRGNPIGFSRVKWLAALLSLTACSQKAIAADIGISQSLLLKWRTEPEFKQQMAQHKRGVVDYFYRCVEASYDEKVFSGDLDAPTTNEPAPTKAKGRRKRKPSGVDSILTEVLTSFTANTRGEFPEHPMKRILNEAFLYADGVIEDIVERWMVSKANYDHTVCAPKDYCLTVWLPLAILALLKERLESPKRNAQGRLPVLRVGEGHLLQAQYRMAVSLYDGISGMPAVSTKHNERMAWSKLQDAAHALEERHLIPPGDMWHPAIVWLYPPKPQLALVSPVEVPHHE